MNQQHLKELGGLLVGLNTREEALAMLKDLLTDSELESVAERVQILKLLSQGMPHRKISETLGVSISKVTRGSHWLQANPAIASKIA